MSINTNGLTAISTGNATWASPTENEMPVAVASQIRGGLWLVPGTADNRLTDIPGIMLQDGMIVYLVAGYTEPGDDTVVRTAATYYRYTNTAARPANGVLDNTIPMWSEFQTGGGTGGGAATAVDDIDALDALAAADPGPTQGQLVLVRDPRGADDADPTINNLPGGIDWDAAATENLNLTVSWDEVDDDWDFIRIAPDNPDDVFVELAGDTMTGTLTIDNTTADQNALVTGAGHDIVLGRGANAVLTGTGTADPVNEQTITVSAPAATAAFDANYEIVLPAAEPTDANRFLRASGTGTTSPFTLEWGAAGGDGATVSVGENPPEAAADDNQGDLWWNSNTGRLFVSFANGDDDPVWTEASPATAGNNQNLQQVLDTGNESTTNLQLSDGAALILENADEDQRITINADDCEADYTVTLPPTAPTADGQVLSVASGTTDAELAWTTPATGDAVPAGTVVNFAGATAPDGWLFCDGSAISRTDNEALFDAIGTTYGTGDGSTTFNIPDTRGMFVRGLNTGDTGEDPDRDLGSTQDASIDTDAISGTMQLNIVGGGGGTSTTSVSGTSGGSWQSNAIRFNPSGTGAGDETRPVNIAFNYIIRNP